MMLIRVTKVLYVVNVKESTDISHLHYAFLHEIQAFAVLSELGIPELEASHKVGIMLRNISPREMKWESCC